MTKDIQGAAEGNVVVTWDQDRTRILAVTRQDDDGRILSVIAEIPAPTEGDAEALALADWIEGEACGGSNWSAKAKRTAEVLRALASKAQPKGGDKANEWRKLAQQFDGQRMAAMAHLRTLLAFPDTHAEAVRAFLAATPAEQIASVALAQAPAPAQPNDTVFYVHQSDLDEVLRFGTAVDCVLGSKPLAGLVPVYAAAQAPAVAHGWRPIETAPSDGREMFVVKAFQVCNGFTGGREYTSDPWCVWRQGDGFARWPHHFAPTHWMPLPVTAESNVPLQHPKEHE